MANTRRLLWEKIEINGKIGFRAMTGTVKSVPCIYDDCAYFKDSYYAAIVRLNKKWGVINCHGETLIDFEYDNISISDSCFVVKHDGLYGLFDKNGNNLAPVKYDAIKRFGYYFVLYKDGKAYALSDKGDMITLKGFDEVVENDEYYPAFIVKEGPKFGLVSDWDKGNIDCQFDEIVRESKRYYRVRKDNKWGLVDYYDGKVTFIKCQFDEIKYLGRLVALKHDSKWGLYGA